MAAPKTKGAPRKASPQESKTGTKQMATVVLEALGGGTKPVSIPLQRGAFQAVVSRPKSMRALMERYGAALEQSRHSGRSVRLVVDIAPEGTATIAAGEIPAEPSQGLPSAEIDQALGAARERGRQRAAAILDSPEMLPSHAFAERIGVSRVTVNAKRKAGQVLGLQGARRGFRFPDWQLGEDGTPFAALPEIFGRLGNSPWAVYRFLVQQHPELDGLTGKEALRRGKTEAVLAAAESIGRGDFA